MNVILCHLVWQGRQINYEIIINIIIIAQHRRIMVIKFLLNTCDVVLDVLFDVINVKWKLLLSDVYVDGLISIHLSRIKLLHPTRNKLDAYFWGLNLVMIFLSATHTCITFYILFYAE